MAEEDEEGSGFDLFNGDVKIGDLIPETEIDNDPDSLVDLDDPEAYEKQIWYPTKEDILHIHEEVIETGGEPGIRDPDRLDYVVDHIKGGPIGKGPRTIPEKTFALIRMLAANHYFVDGNKRTALGTAEVFLNFNGLEVEYGDEMREFLKRIARDESDIETSEGVAFVRERIVTDPAEWTLSTGLFVLLRTFVGDEHWADRKS